MEFYFTVMTDKKKFWVRHKAEMLLQLESQKDSDDSKSEPEPEVEPEPEILPEPIPESEGSLYLLISNQIKQHLIYFQSCNIF